MFVKTGSHVRGAQHTTITISDKALTHTGYPITVAMILFISYVTDTYYYYIPSSVPVRTNHPLPSTQSLTFFHHKFSGQTYRHH